MSPLQYSRGLFVKVWATDINKNQGKALYIINFGEIAYHQHEVLYIIIEKAIQPTVDDIRLRR